jgi:hypothetical protein
VNSLKLTRVRKGPREITRYLSGISQEAPSTRLKRLEKTASVAEMKRSPGVKRALKRAVAAGIAQDPGLKPLP